MAWLVGGMLCTETGPHATSLMALPCRGQIIVFSVQPYMLTQMICEDYGKLFMGKHHLGSEFHVT